jgi:hypothetical protein
MSNEESGETKEPLSQCGRRARLPEGWGPDPAESIARQHSLVLRPLPSLPEGTSTTRSLPEGWVNSDTIRLVRAAKDAADAGPIRSSVSSHPAQVLHRLQHHSGAW